MHGSAYVCSIFNQALAVTHSVTVSDNICKMDNSSQKHEQKVCSRCQRAFTCKVGDVANCQCSVVKLSDTEQRYIDEKYNDCLCCVCLKEMKTEHSVHQLNNKMKFLYDRG